MLKRNQKPLAILAHNENTEDTPLLTFIFPENRYTFRWSKETLKAKYPTIDSSEDQTVTLMLTNGAFSISKTSDMAGFIISGMKKPIETSPEKAARIGFISGIASGIVGLTLTSLLFTALLPSLLSGSASGIIMAAFAALTLLAAIVLIPTCSKYGKLSAIFKPESIDDKSNTATTQSLDL